MKKQQSKEVEFKRSKHNPRLTEEGQEILDPISVTIPDESYTIRELLERYSYGTMPGIKVHSDYNEIEDLDSDLTDKIEDLSDIDDMKAKFERELEDEVAEIKAKKGKADIQSEESENNVPEHTEESSKNSV